MIHRLTIATFLNGVGKTICLPIGRGKTRVLNIGVIIANGAACRRYGEDTTHTKTREERKRKKENP